MRPEVRRAPRPFIGGPALVGRWRAASDEIASSAGQSGEEAAGDFDRRVVKTARLGIRAEDVRSSSSKAQSIASDLGGSVQSSRIDRGEGSVSANLVLLVPSNEFEKALDELRGLGKKVTTDAVSGQEVTEEFVDLKSRERNLLAGEESLLKLYDRAESVEDSLAIQRELTNIRGEIEQVQGRIQYLEQRTDSSRIDLTIEPVAGAPATRSAWEPASVAAQAWSASLSVIQTLANAAISAIVFGWWLAPILISALIWWRRRSHTPEPTGSS